MMTELGIIAVMASVISGGVIYITLSSLKRERIKLKLESNRSDEKSGR